MKRLFAVMVVGATACGRVRVDSDPQEKDLAAVDVRETAGTPPSEPGGGGAPADGQAGTGTPDAGTPPVETNGCAQEAGLPACDDPSSAERQPELVEEISGPPATWT